MIRDDAVVEIQRRLNRIRIINGYGLNLTFIERNPEEDPDPRRMPMASIFEFPDTTIEIKKRGASVPPAYRREFTILVELWYKSESEGEVSGDISTFVRNVRYALFNDGTTLGRLITGLAEVELSRVYRPGIQNHVVGIGMVLKAHFIEDFNNITLTSSSSSSSRSSSSSSSSTLP
jgi:hypothetical protein